MTLSGNEELMLEVTNPETGSSDNEVAKIENFENCGETPPPPPPGDEDCGDEIDVDAIGVCDEGDEEGKRASFTFEVTIEDPCDEQKVYEYDFSNVKGLKGYAVIGIEVVNADDVRVLTPGEKSGEFELAAGVESFAVTVEIEAEDALSGNEELMLEVTNPETGSSDNEVAKIENFENCGETPPPPPPGDEDCGDEIDVDAIGVCDEGDEEGKRASFTFEVTIEDPCDEAEGL